MDARVIMSNRIVLALLAVAAFALVSLASGAAYLEVELPGGLPLGNALAALGLCAAAGAAVGLGTSGTVLRAVSVASFIAAVAWLPLSVALAGNLALNFGGGRGLAWMIISLGTALSVVCSLAWAVVVSLFATRGRTDAA